MSINTAMMAGVSGLISNSSALAIFSDNIANVNSVGYKRTVADFSALVTSQFKASTYNAGGVFASSRSLINQQGALNATSSQTDLAVAGDGFFVVTGRVDDLTTSDPRYFTRAGAFSPDAGGFLRNAAGYYLQGWPFSDDGTIDQSPSDLGSLQPVTLSGVSSTAELTDEMSVNANLDASTTAFTGAYTAGALTAGTVDHHFQRTLQIYDSQGGVRTLTASFLKTGPNTWAAEISTYLDGRSSGPQDLIASGNITFNPDGTILSVPASMQNLTIPWTAATGVATPQSVAFDLDGGGAGGGLTQFSSASTLISVTSNGAPPGDLTGVQIGRDGVVTGLFSNGRSRSLYQVPVATFLNPNGLLPERGGAFKMTLDSGTFTMKPPGIGGGGVIQSGALEGSTVDLATEFTGLITTQRAYSASSKIVTTADEMLEELIRIKR